jgi:hypothetical protein
MNAPKIQLCFDFEASADGMDNAVKLLKFADTLTPGAPTPPHTPPPVPKGKAAAPAPAPKGKTAAPAAKTNSKKPAPAPEPDIMDLGGDEDEDDDMTGGLGLADDDQEEADFDGTPEEAKEEALAKLRVLLGSGLKAQVKEVQQIMKVAKFHDVPAEQGFEFLAAVKAVEAKIAKN